MNTLPLCCISRHRINSDGNGISSLVAVKGCPLNCRWCINREPLKTYKVTDVTPQELYERVKIDNLYFLSTDGGVTFGGEEPLLYAGFISDFTDLPDVVWNVNIETSLNVPLDNLKKVIGKINEYFVDIKDMNTDIYKSYCGTDNSQVIENLKYLISHEDSERIKIRIPLIPDFNTESDREKSAEKLKKMGFDRFDFFQYIIPGKKP